MGQMRISGLASNMDTDSIVKQLMDAHKLKQTKISNKKTKLEWKQEKWKDLNTKLYKFYQEQVTKLQFQSNFNTKKATLSDATKATVEATANAVDGSHEIEVTGLASAQYWTSGVLKKTNGDPVQLSTQLSEIGFGDADAITINGSSTSITKNSTIGDFVTACKDKGLNASFDSKQQRLFISSKASGEANKFDMAGSLEKLSLAKPTDPPADPPTGYRTEIKATNCTVIYNGASLSSNTNTLSANGLTITVKDKGKTTINVEKDVDATYNMIKDFFKSYNEILKEMNTLYDAKSARGYEPLTDEEREAMTDDQIEKWESKIKDSLFRRDDTLSGLMSAMKGELNANVKVDGKSYSLSSFGICTSSDYSEKGLLHIYGDKEDSTYSDKDDKLKKALRENPDAVITTLTTLTQNLRETMYDKMGKTALKSAMKFYNDKEITDQLNTYTKDISNWDTKLSKLEDKYYKQFTAMEKAMASLQSQSNALSGLLGSN